MRTSAQDIDFVSMAYTLQVGRESMEERVGFVAHSLDTLTEKLVAWLECDATTDGVFHGHAKRNGGVVPADGSRSASWLLEQWTQGRTIDWNAGWPATHRPARMHLPGYPFAKERYWAASAFGGKTSAPSHRVETVDGESIEDIINRIADDSIEADEGFRRLTALV